MTKNRCLALTAITLLAGGCARGGESDGEAALVDTANSATITGDTSLAPPPVLVDTTGAAPVDSAPAQAAPGADTTTAQAKGDSAAHP